MQVVTYPPAGVFWAWLNVDVLLVVVFLAGYPGMQDYVFLWALSGGRGGRGSVGELVGDMGIWGGRGE